jgi:hypothetical protein
MHSGGLNSFINLSNTICTFKKKAALLPYGEPSKNTSPPRILVLFWSGSEARPSKTTAIATAKVAATRMSMNL